MANHPSRTVAAALKRIIASHSGYKTASAADRARISANIHDRLHDAVDASGPITAARLVAWYDRNGLTAAENVKL